MANQGNAAATAHGSDELVRSLSQSDAQSRVMLDAIALLASKGSEQAAASERPLVRSLGRRGWRCPTCGPAGSPASAGDAWTSWRTGNSFPPGKPSW